MRKSGKLLLATLIGTGAISVAKHRHQLKNKAKHLVHEAEHSRYGNVGIRTYYVGNLYSKLKPYQKNHVIDILNYIIPREDQDGDDNLAYQNDVAHFMNLLQEILDKNLSTLQENDVVDRIDVSKDVAYCLILALRKTRLLSHDASGRNWVRNYIIRRNYDLLNNYRSKGHLVEPQIFTRVLRNVIAYDVYSYELRE